MLIIYFNPDKIPLVKFYEPRSQGLNASRIKRQSSYFVRPGFMPRRATINCR
jgi:hypothetical protein